MFRVIPSLLFFGALSPVVIGMNTQEAISLLPVSSPPAVEKISIENDLSASGAIVMDVDSGETVFGYAADIARPMGSLAKIMTAIIILEEHDLDEVVTVPRSAQNVEGNVVRLLPGEKYTVRELLMAMLIASANDAAHTLALYHSGSIAGFAEEMNFRARALGLTRTHFENPVGFDGKEQYATPRELAWLSVYALKNEIFASFVSRQSAVIQDSSGEHKIVVYSTNRLLTLYPSVFSGVKTGTTDGAGQCLISLAKIGEKSYLFVVLGSSDRYKDVINLYQAMPNSTDMANIAQQS